MVSFGFSVVQDFVHPQYGVNINQPSSSPTRGVGPLQKWSDSPHFTQRRTRFLLTGVDEYGHGVKIMKGTPEVGGLPFSFHLKPPKKSWYPQKKTDPLTLLDGGKQFVHAPAVSTTLDRYIETSIYQWVDRLVDRLMDLRVFMIYHGCLVQSLKDKLMLRTLSAEAEHPENACSQDHMP